MTKEQAIEILKGQLQKLNTLNTTTARSWTVQTSSYIKVFFGEASNEYEYIQQFSFSPSVVSIRTDYDQYMRSRFPAAKIFNETSIETISHFGLTKREWRHVSHYYSALFWTVFSGIVIFAFWAGSQLAGYKGDKAPSGPSVYKNDSTHTK